MAASVPIDPWKLIGHAEDLAAHQPGPGRPRPVWLRRAVSAAYYASFHQIALYTAWHLLAGGTRTERLQLCRSIGHRQIRDVCDWVDASNPVGRTHSRAIVEALRRNKRLREVCNAFGQLQEARHQADYDHQASFDKATTLSYVEQSRRVVTSIAELDGQADLERFLALVALNAQLR